MERQHLVEIAKTGVLISYYEYHNVIEGTPLVHIEWNLGAIDAYIRTYCHFNYSIRYKNGSFRERPDHPSIRLLSRLELETSPDFEERARNQIREDFRLNYSEFYGSIKNFGERILKPTSPYFLTQIGRMQMILDYHDDWLRVTENYRHYAMIKSRFEKFIKTQQDKWKEFGFGH